MALMLLILLDRLDSAMLPLRIMFGSDSELFQRVSNIRAGVQAAFDRGDIYFEQAMDYPAISRAQPKPLPDRIFFLTGPDCTSACLDFADLMLAIPGVTHVGHETGADTFYLEVTTAKLPSGLGQLAFPSAIHRGRVRGVNQSLVPEQQYPGNISNTGDVEAWVSSL